MIGKQCLKQSVIAIIMNKNKMVGFGGNFIHKDVSYCGREYFKCKTGEGYDICKTVCDQSNHAEVEACLSVKDNEAIDGTLYLIGHTYVCDSCMKVVKEHGIKKIIICDTEEIINV